MRYNRLLPTPHKLISEPMALKLEFDLCSMTRKCAPLWNTPLSSACSLTLASRPFAHESPSQWLPSLCLMNSIFELTLLQWSVSHFHKSAPPLCLLNLWALCWWIQSLSEAIPASNESSLYLRWCVPSLSLDVRPSLCAATPSLLRSAPLSLCAAMLSLLIALAHALSLSCLLDSSCFSQSSYVPPFAFSTLFIACLPF